VKKLIPVLLTLCIAWTSVASAAVDPVAVWKKQVASLQAQVKKLTSTNVMYNKTIMSLKAQSSRKDAEIASLKAVNERLIKIIDDTAASYPKVSIGQEQVIRIPANPAKGFNYPYYLKIPGNMVAGRYLMVESTNTGISTDDLSVQEDRVKNIHVMNHQLSSMLDVPLLIPVFPRPQSQILVHTHDLDRDTLLIQTGEMARLDLQLKAMIHHAQGLLAVNRVSVKEKVLMTGYSASGRFATKFAALHPEMVFALSAGGIDGASILPVTELNGRALRFPVGVADMEVLTGKPFDLEGYKKVRQFIFMGGKDTSDMTLNDDGYDREDSALVWDVLGKDMVKVRWPAYQRVMKESGAAVQFRTYEEIGHSNTYEMFLDQAAFFRASMGE
jgi:hypothetical protein